MTLKGTVNIIFSPRVRATFVLQGNMSWVNEQSTVQRKMQYYQFEYKMTTHILKVKEILG